VTEAVVDLLEAVDVEVHERHQGAGRTATLHRLGDAQLESGAVEDAGERVHLCQLGEPPFFELLARDVADHGVKAEHGAAIARELRDVVGLVADIAAAAGHLALERDRFAAQRAANVRFDRLVARFAQQRAHGLAVKLGARAAEAALVRQVVEAVAVTMAFAAERGGCAGDREWAVRSVPAAKNREHRNCDLLACQFERRSRRAQMPASPYTARCIW